MMKTKAAFILLVIFLLLTRATYSQGQLKIGHVDIMKILSQLPERDSAQAILDKETREIQTEFEEMQVIYNKLVDDYTRGQSTFSELVKKAREDEILDKQKRIQEFEQNATATLQRRNGELLQPIYEKVVKTIERVATQYSFTYILDISKGSVVFTSKDSQNIDQLVLDLLEGLEK
jgi:outer membrane protein